MRSSRQGRLGSRVNPARLHVFDSDMNNAGSLTSRGAGITFVALIVGIYLIGGHVVCAIYRSHETISDAFFIGTWGLAVLAGAAAVGLYFVEWTNRVLLALPAFIGAGMIAAVVVFFVWLLAIDHACHPFENSVAVFVL